MTNIREPILIVWFADPDPVAAFEIVSGDELGIAVMKVFAGMCAFPVIGCPTL